MILDTDFVIDLLENKVEAEKKMSELEQRSIPISITSIAVFELVRGLSSFNAEIMQKGYLFIDAVNVYILDSTAAKIAGKIAQQLDQKGVPINPQDSMIAGIALKYNEAVLTGNIKHFSRIENLVVETY
ncbi:PIN domain-containing protein [Candidatus Woesearchaeota archaeon]|nr:PIN domain-containing protein [Candidatus Woesearchaeota archaeon]